MESKVSLIDGLKNQLLEKTQVDRIIFTIMLISLSSWVILRATQLATRVMPIPQEFTVFIWTSIMISVWCFILLNTVKFIISIQSLKNQLYLIIAWILSLFMLVAPVTMLFNGMKIGAIAITSAVSGFDATAINSSLAMAKLYPFHPIVPFTIGIEMLMGGVKSADLFVSLGTVTNLLSSVVFVAISSAACLILRRGRGLIPWGMLFAAASIVLLISKSGTHQQVKMAMPLYGVSLFMLWSQIFIWYSLLMGKCSNKRCSGLPKPLTSKRILLFALLAVPLLADASNYSDVFLR